LLLASKYCVKAKTHIYVFDMHMYPKQFVLSSEITSQKNLKKKIQKPRANLLMFITMPTTKKREIAVKL